MTTIRVRKDANYFAASNEPFNDTQLSWEARGLMGYLLSKPDSWKISMIDLEKKGPAGNHKLRRMLAELRKAGYMNRIRITLENKRFDWITEVYESPSQNPTCRFSTSGSSTSGKLPDIVSTDLLSTKEQVIFEANKKVDAILDMANFPGAKIEARIDSILSYLGQTFHRNTETAEWKKFAKYIDSEHKLKGWDVKVFVAWLFSQDGYKPEFWPVKKMMEFYPSAFSGEVAQKTGRQLETIDR